MFECHYCFEPATSTGPLSRGTESVALVRHETKGFVFCSPECRDMWFTVVGNEVFDVDYYDDLYHAEGVDPETLQTDTATS